MNLPKYLFLICTFICLSSCTTKNVVTASAEPELAGANSDQPRPRSKGAYIPREDRRR